MQSGASESGGLSTDLSITTALSKPDEPESDPRGQGAPRFEGKTLPLDMLQYRNRGMYPQRAVVVDVSFPHSERVEALSMVVAMNRPRKADQASRNQTFIGVALARLAVRAILDGERPTVAAFTQTGAYNQQGGVENPSGDAFIYLLSLPIG